MLYLKGNLYTQLLFKRQHICISTIALYNAVPNNRHIIHVSCFPNTFPAPGVSNRPLQNIFKKTLSNISYIENIRFVSLSTSMYHTYLRERYTWPSSAKYSSDGRIKYKLKCPLTAAILNAVSIRTHVCLPDVQWFNKHSMAAIVDSFSIDTVSTVGCMLLIKLMAAT